MSDNLKHIISLKMGNNYDSGEQGVETISSNLSKLEIIKAYDIGKKLVGVDIVNLCSDFEENKLSEENCEALKKAGLDFHIDSEWLEPRSFSGIYLFLVKKGNPKFEYQDFDNSNNEIFIGGYGLY